MCMKNVNVNAIFSDILLNQEDNTLSLLNIGKPLRLLEENDARKITQLSMAVIVSATQSRSSFASKDINPDEIFSFHDKYELMIRLTETISGKFKDVGGFEIDPAQNDIHEGICRHTFNYTHLGLYKDISLPEKNSNERFVIKLLIRRKMEAGQENDWVVQTVIPLTFETEMITEE